MYKNCTNHDLLQFSTAFGRYCYNLGLLVHLCVESFCCKLSCYFYFYFTLYLISSNLTGVLVQFDWCIGAFAGLLWGTVFPVSVGSWDWDVIFLWVGGILSWDVILLLGVHILVVGLLLK